MDYTEIAVAFVVSSMGGGGIVALIQTWLQHKLKSETKEDEIILNLRVGLKIIIQHDIRQLANRCIEQGYITLEEKEFLMEMYQTYKKLGGNGRLDTIMSEVEELEVRVNECKV